MKQYIKPLSLIIIASACAIIGTAIDRDYAAHKAERICDLAAVDPAYMDQCSAALRGEE